MKLYNTLSRCLQEFKPINNQSVKLYTCGPTVYHYAHIGNLRNTVFNDTLRRTLEVNGYNVNHVMNITDVGHLVSDGDEGEDKLEKGASREGKTVWEVAEYYINAYKTHTNALNILTPIKTIRATDAIKSQIEMISALIDKGFAYKSEQAVYFDVSRLDDYGKLSGQKLSEKEVGARSEVVTDTNKLHPQDFALWFFTVGHFSDHQMHWSSPWGDGFPGWHLECSAIIHQELGETIDIHTGGVDHIGTHHTNEIAQSEAAFDKPLANFWIHNEFLNQGEGKMSKSGGDTITLDTMTEKDYDPLALRLFYLQSHYRSQASFSWENLEAAQNRLKTYQSMADLVFQPRDTGKPSLAENHFETHIQAIKTSLNNDLSTPDALKEISDLANNMENLIIEKSQLCYFINALNFIDKVFGLNLAIRKDINAEQKQIINKRTQARLSKDWAKSDNLRDELIKQGIGLRDTDYGPIWYRL